MKAALIVNVEAEFDVMLKKVVTASGRGATI
jgi:hypothetical protein